MQGLNHFPPIRTIPGELPPLQPIWEIKARKDWRVLPVFVSKKGVDPRKDQSYVLYILRQTELCRLLLPLGAYEKDEIRKIAKKHNLPAADRTEAGRSVSFRGERMPHLLKKETGKRGNLARFASKNNEVIGIHKGIHGYTVGQRKGLGIIISPIRFMW